MLNQSSERRQHRHAELHDKRDEVIDNEVVTATVTAPRVFVYEDENGVPYSTTTEGVAAATSASSSSANSTYVSVTPTTSSSAAAVTTSAAPVVEAVVAASSSSSAWTSSSVWSSESASSTYAASSSVSSTASSSAAASSSTSSSSSGDSYGISYSPYNADGSCKTSSQVLTDFDKIGSGYSIVRTYGTDCDQTATVLAACQAKGMKIMIGIFDLGSITDEISTLIAAAKSGWDSVDTIAVGNELVNSGTSASVVVAALKTARVLLTAAGYTGNIVTVDTLVAMRSNPELCNESDYCAANSHPFFDGGYTADQAGTFLTEQIPTLAAVVDSGKRIVITETGWPSQGDTNGKAVPSSENQQAAISAIKTSFADNPSGVILFTPFNDMWKTSDSAQFNAEQYWGFLGDSPSG